MVTAIALVDSCTKTSFATGCAVLTNIGCSLTVGAVGTDYLAFVRLQKVSEPIQILAALTDS